MVYASLVRTTLTLDDDVAALLKRVRAERALGVKDAINQGLRHGLGRMIAPATSRPAYRTPSVDAGQLLIGDLDDVAEVLAVAEGEAFR